MPKNFSRRNFLAIGAKSTAAVVAYSTINKQVARSAVRSTNLVRASAAFEPAFAQLDYFLERHMRETGVPGLTLALANRDGSLKVSGYGYADSKTALRVTPEMMFEIGSISKSFVALVLMQLRDEGKLDLNKPIVSYLPWLKIKSKFESITTHHILSHSAGLPEAPLLLDAMLDELWTAYPPGSRFLYSNTGYNILGFLIEAIDKQPFPVSIRARLLNRLGMASTSPVITYETRRRMAVGYQPVYDDRPFPLLGTIAEAPWFEMDMAAGSIASTPGDMAKYLRMLVSHGASGDGRVVSEDSFGLFIKPHIRSPFRGEDASYSYGLWVSDIQGHTRLRHTGGMVAFSSSLDVDLTSGVGAFASVNANLRGYRPVAVTRYAIDLLNASLAGKPLPDAPAPPAAPTEVKNAVDYAGTYTSPSGKKLNFIASGQRLILEYAGASIPLERAGRDLFLVKHPAFELFLMGFVRENNRVVEAFHGSDWYAGQNYAGPSTFEAPKEWAGYVGHYHSDSPWYGDTRIVMRKGKLYSDGVQPLVPRGDGRFGINDSEAPDWIAFESIVNGRAMRLNFSGIVFRRAFTP